MLKTSTLSWAATRSGLSLGEFLATLTPEREAAIQDAYNAWRQSKGLAPVQAAPDIAPALRVERPAPPPEEEEDDEAEASDAVGDDYEDAEDDDWAMESRREDDFSDYGGDWEGGAAAEDVLVDVPLELPDEELVAPELFASEASQPDDDDAADEPEDREADQAPEAVSAPAPAPAAVPMGASLSTLLARLPKDVDEAYYTAVRGAAASVSALRAEVQARIEARRKSRKATGPLKALLGWLDSRDDAQ